MHMRRKVLIGMVALLPAAWLTMPIEAASVPNVTAFWVVGAHGHLNPGTEVTLGARGRASWGPVWYQFREETLSGWKTLQHYGPNSILRLGRLYGPARIVVTALTPTEVRLHQYWRARTVNDYLNVGSSAALSVPSRLLVGETATVRGAAKNIINPVYQLIYQLPTGGWRAAGPYQSSPAFHWVPPEAGTYRLVVRAKDVTAPANVLFDRVAAAKNVSVKPVTVGYGDFGRSAETPGSALYDLRRHGQDFSIAAPRWYTLSPNDGTLSTTSSASKAPTVVQTAQSEGDQVWPVITANGDPTSGFDGTGAIAALAQDAKSAHYGGYVLDWEGLDSADASYVRFVGKLGRALHQNGLRLMVTVLPLPNGAYPYKTLAQSADYLDLLAYPEYSTTGPSALAPNPGPTEGLPWVEQATKLARADVPASKLVLGIAPYGQSWTYTNSGFQSAGSAIITDRTIQTSLKSQPGAAVFDPLEGELEISTGPLALAPSAPLSTDPTVFHARVANLQFLLSTVLLRYDVAHHLTPSAPLATDGGYGPATAQAVAAFQKDYGITTSTPGVYDAATATALQQVIDSENIGDTVTWDENSVGSSADTTATTLLKSLAERQGLAGVSLWRLGYQAPGYW